MQVIKTNNNEVFSWCPSIEENALNQIKVIADLPFIFKHCALMPDAHMGMEMPIGGVVATKGVIIPNFVGVDIGCGMCALKTSLKAEELTEDKKDILLHSFQRSIPVGFSHNDKKRIALLKQKYQQKVYYIFEKTDVSNDTHTPVANLDDAVFEQLGTLGGGNHFIEVQKDETNTVWLMIHSGSRNIGKTVCDYYNDIARDTNKEYLSVVPDNIPFLPTSTEDGKSYIIFMDFALRFAFLNRQVMLEDLKKDMEHVFPNITFENMINIHHNYASLENHFGANVWVHRKGATLASQETVGIIPGSMGTSSYIVRGLGNKLSYNSCSHGAGRTMGRNDFNKQFNTEEGLKQIEESLKDVTHSKFQKDVSRKGKETGMIDVSECPQAYKDIEDVMNNQTDLVTPIHKLSPLVSMKG